MVEQKANTIILEFSKKYDKDDIRNIQKGKGKLFRDVDDAIDQLREEDEVSDSVQPIVIIVKEKSDKGLFD